MYRSTLAVAFVATIALCNAQYYSLASVSSNVTVSTANAGTAAWTGNPAGTSLTVGASGTVAGASDQVTLPATTTAAITSQLLVLTAFNFTALPCNATVTGVQVAITRMSSVANAGRDSVVQLTLNGTAVGQNKAITATAWPTTAAAVTYGTGQTDLWTLTSAQLNYFTVSSLGVNIAATRPVGGLGNTVASIRMVTITVFALLNNNTQCPIVTTGTTGTSGTSGSTGASTGLSTGVSTGASTGQAGTTGSTGASTGASTGQAGTTGTTGSTGASTGASTGVAPVTTGEVIVGTTGAEVGNFTTGFATTGSTTKPATTKPATTRRPTTTTGSASALSVMCSIVVVALAAALF